MQRNAFLKESRHLMGSAKGKAALDVWDEQLVTVGTRIMIKRAKVINTLSNLAQIIYKKISPFSTLELTYEPSVKIKPFFFNKEKESEIKEKWRNLFHKELLKGRQTEITRGVTLVGRHRDDMAFILDGIDMKSFGSQGQQRLAVLALRLAELDFIKQEVGENAILLLDDVSSELDTSKKINLWEYIDEEIQTIITTTDEKTLGGLYNPERILKITSGTVQEVK